LLSNLRTLMHLEIQGIELILTLCFNGTCRAKF